MVPDNVLEPINDIPDYTRIGIIKAVWKGEKYPVCKLTYTHYWNEEFMYVFEPMYDQIDQLMNLDNNAFLGIPSIDLDLHLDAYVRRNYVPAFIRSRTPSKNRVGMMCLMKEVGLNYYDPFEWLIRTPLMASQDNLIVEEELFQK